jgi:hypothetical protein
MLKELNYPMKARIFLNRLVLFSKSEVSGKKIMSYVIQMEMVACLGTL